MKKFNFNFFQTFSKLNDYLKNNKIISDVYNLNSDWWIHLKNKVLKNKSIIQVQNK
jgi:hypothetical protein